MADLSGYSDDQLAKIAGVPLAAPSYDLSTPQGKQKAINDVFTADADAAPSPAPAAQAAPDLSGMSDEDLAKIAGVPLSQDDVQAKIAKLPWYGRAMADIAQHPEDASPFTLIKKGLSSVGDEMMGGAGDLYDLMTGDSDQDLEAAKQQFNDKFKSGDAKSSDVKDLYLSGFADNPGGKALGASRLFPPIALGSAVMKNVVNPLLEEGAEKLGMDKEDVSLAEIPTMLAGAGAGKSSMVPEFISKGVGKIGGKVSAAMSDIADAPLESSSVVPETMAKTAEGQPLLISHSGAREGIENFKKFRDQDLSSGGLNQVADTLQEMQKTNPDARAIDAMTKAEGDLPTGANISGLAKSIANSPGQGRTMLAQMAGRGRQAADQIGSAFDTFVSKLPYSKVAADSTAAKEASTPLYQAAYANNPSINDPVVNDILERPAGQAALQKASIQMMNDMREAGPVSASTQQGAPAPAPSEMESYAKNAKDLLSKPAPKMPTSLTSFVQRNGGISDMSGELKQYGLDSKNRPAFISKNGSSVDDMALKAWQEGYFPEHTERPDVNEFLDALQADHNGYGPRYREQDTPILDELNARKGADQFLNENPQAAQSSDIAPQDSGHSLRKLNYVKIYFDEMANKSAAKGDMNDASIYSDLGNRMRDALDNADATATNGKGGMYAQARATFSTGPRMEDAFKFGSQFETKRPEELQAFFNSKDIPDTEKGAALAGVRDKLQSVTDRKSVGQNPIASMNKVGLQKRLRVIGGDNADDLITTLQNAAHMSKNDSLLMGSPTYANAAFSESAAPPHSLPGRVAGEIPVVGGLIGYGIDKALAGRTAKMSTDAKAMIGRILTSDSPAELRALAHKMGEK